MKHCILQRDGDDVYCETCGRRFQYLNDESRLQGKIVCGKFKGIVKAAVTQIKNIVIEGKEPPTRDETQRRREICNKCDNYVGKRCKLCGCPTERLIYLIENGCKDGKW